MIDLRTRGKICVEWSDLEPNFDGKTYFYHRHDGIVVDSWPDGADYYLLVMDLKGRLHRLSADKVRIVDTQTHIDHRNA